MPGLSLNQRERIEVKVDGEEVTVFNWVNLSQPATVRGHNPVVEPYETAVYAGDSQMEPDAVTHWVADELEEVSLINVDLDAQGIDVIDVTSEEVTIL